MTDKYTDTINVLETNIDDCSGEVLGYVMDKLFAGGAKDVFYTSIFMKKNRPAYKLTVLCFDEDVEKMEDIIFSETTSIGIRKRKEERVCLKRNFETVDTKYGKIDVKTVFVNDEKRIYPEFESVKKAAEKNNVPFIMVFDEAKRKS